MNLATNLLRAARRYPDNVALRLDDIGVTYARLDELSAAAAGELQVRGVRSGDRVGIMLPNVPQFAVWYYAVLRLGAIVVPMNPLLKRREVAYYLDNSGAQLLIVWHEVPDEAVSGTDVRTVVIDATSSPSADPVLEIVTRDDEDTAVILYTSGTTGEPKGAELTHANLRHNVDVTVETLLDLTSDDVVFGGLPLFHVFGQTCGLNSVIAVGATLTLVPRFDPLKALAVLARDQVTVMQGVPTMYIAMLNHPESGRSELPNLRVCISGGSPFPVEALLRFENAFSCTILEGYGLSETSPVASFNHPGQRVPGSIGIPVRGVEMRVVDESGVEVLRGEIGEIVVRGHNVMQGYWDRPTETAAAIVDGWFHTGDLGRVDVGGIFTVVDRKKDLIIRGGYNVYPREVEEILYEHPAVAEAAVIGVPHPELGEEVAAAVTLRPGRNASEDELRQFVKDRLAAYKYPRHVRIVDALPKGPTGKILKRMITSEWSSQNA